MNTVIRSLYSPGFTSMMLSFYRTNLAIAFTPWISKDKTGRDRYDTKNFTSTTISDESAAALYFLSTQIIQGTVVDPLQYVIQGNKNSTLLFESEAGKTFLTLEKGKDRIVFEFPVHEYRVREDGKIATKTIPAGLIAFAEVLQSYLSAVLSDRQQQDTKPQIGTGFGGQQTQGFTSVWK